MDVTIDGQRAHGRTGGVDFASRNGPLVLLVHGAGMDGTAWQLQTRYLAHHGYRAIAVDLPGHGLSRGSPLLTIEAMAEWTGSFIEAVGVGPAHLIGHSMGTFIGLQLASIQAELVQSLVLLGTAGAMPVHPDLLTAAADDLPAAAALMASWAHARPAHIGANPSPGQWMLGGAKALVETGGPGSLAADFNACATYEGAAAAAARVACPTTVVIGKGDKMTPPRAAADLLEHLPSADVVELADTGHMIMTENPHAVRRLLLTALA